MFSSGAARFAQGKRPQPELNFSSIQARECAGSPVRQNPFVQKALVGHFSSVRMMIPFCIVYSFQCVQRGFGSLLQAQPRHKILVEKA